MTYSNGSSYHGMFSQGLRHGKGVQTYPNGDLFRGMYHLGASHFFYCMSMTLELTFKFKYVCGCVNVCTMYTINTFMAYSMKEFFSFEVHVCNLMYFCIYYMLYAHAYVCMYVCM
jgi:hypothetical protein